MKKLIVLRHLLSYGLCIGVFGALTLTPTIGNRVEKVKSFANNYNTKAVSDVKITGRINMTLGDYWSPDDLFPLNGGLQHMTDINTSYPIAQVLYWIDTKGFVANQAFFELGIPLNNFAGLNMAYGSVELPVIKDIDTWKWKEEQLSSETITEYIKYGNKRGENTGFTLNDVSGEGHNPLTVTRLNSYGANNQAMDPNLFINIFITAPLVAYGTQLHWSSGENQSFQWNSDTGLWAEPMTEDKLLKYLSPKDIRSTNKMPTVSYTGKDTHGFNGSTWMKINNEWYVPQAGMKQGQYKINVFNDFDSNGNLIKTHMFDYKKGKTKLPTLKINESKFDKESSVNDQNLNVNDLVSFTNYENLPASAGRDVTAVRDYDAGTIVFTYKPKVYLNEVNRLTTPQTDPSYKPITIKISGFAKSTTEIKALAVYPHDIIVDKWIEAMKTNNELDASKLDDYLDLTSVPGGAKYTITLDPDLSKVYNYKEGIINFKIKASKSFYGSGIIKEINTADFDIQLKLGKRITNITKKAVEPSKIIAADMKNKLFSGSQLNVTEFSKYADFIAPVDNTKYYLVPNSYKCNTGDGTVDFAIYPDMYYDAESNLIKNTADKIVKDFKFHFDLKPSTTIIEAKKVNSPEHRVDQFIEQITNTDGTVKDLAALEKYINIEHLPTGSIFTIQNVLPLDYGDKDYRDTITFDLKASKSNNDKNVPVKDAVKTLSIKLLPQYKPTDAVLKKTFTNPDRIDAFKSKITSLNGDQLVAYLRQYIDFTSLHADANVTATIANLDLYQGTLDLDLAIENYYDINSDPDKGTKKFSSFKMKLPAAPTSVDVIKPVDKSVRLDRFVKLFADETTGVVNNLSVLQQYVSFSVWNPNTTLTIDLGSITMDNATGDWSGNLIMQEANDTDSSRVTNKSFPLAFKFAEKYDPTEVYKLENYPRIQMDDFRDYLFDANGIANDKIYDYIDVHSLPPGAEIKLVKIEKDYPNARVDLTLSISKYYDADSDLQQTIKSTRASTGFEKTFSFDLLSPPTAMAAHPGYDRSERVDRFAASFRYLTDDALKKALTNYVDFSYLPANTKLLVDQKTFHINDSPGILSFNIIATRYFDKKGDLITSDCSFPITLYLGDKYEPTEVSRLENYPPVQMDDFRDYLFDANGIANDKIYDYIDVHSLPPGAEIKLVKIEKDYPNARVDLTISLSKYYDANSDLQQTIKSTRASTGFEKTFSFDLLSPPTAITEHPGYDASVRVDRFAASFRNLTDDALIKALTNYVDFSYLPTNTKLSVDQDSLNIIDLPGKLSFNIIATRYFDNEGYLQTSKTSFPITLNLADKNASTSIAAKPSNELPTDLIRVDRFIAALGASKTNPEITNKDVLDDYIDISSLPPNAVLSVDYTKEINIDPIGALDFWIKTSLYYDADSDLRQNYSFPISLFLTQRFDTTTITAKTSNLPNVRADRLLNTFMNDLGFVTNRSVLEQYIDIHSLPAEAELYVSNTNVDSKLGTVSFDLYASHYYDHDADLQNDSLAEKKNPFPINLQLLPKNDPTDFVAKPILPEDVIVTNLTDYLVPDGVVDVARLSEYIDIVSLAPDTNILVEEVSYSATTGAITYNIDVNKYYDEEGDLHNKGKTYTITLQLSPVNDPTEIYALSAYPDVLDVATFKDYVADADGKAIIQNLQKFVGIISLPSKSELTITWGAEVDTSINFTISASQYYNENHQLAYDKDFEISLTLANKFDPTIIKAWDTYPQISVGVFFKKVNPQGMINYGELSKYLDLSTVPYDAKLTISSQNAIAKTGVATFTITTSAWYDENNVRRATDKAFAISLNLTPQHPATSLYAITNVSKDLTLDDFWTQISSNGELDVYKLANYVNLDTLAPKTNLEYLNPSKSWSGNISFDLKVDQYYDADGLLNFGKKIFKITLVTTATQFNAEKIVDYTWLYITLSLLAVILIGTVLFLIIKNKKSKYSNRI